MAREINNGVAQELRLVTDHFVDFFATRSHADARLDSSFAEDEDEREESIENYETTPFVIDLAGAQRRRDDATHKEIPASTSRRGALSPPQRQPSKRARDK